MVLFIDYEVISHELYLFARTTRIPYEPAPTLVSLPIGSRRRRPRFARVARTQRRAARRLEFKGPNQFFSQHRAVTLKSERVREAVWDRVWEIFTRVMAQEKGIFALRD